MKSNFMKLLEKNKTNKLYFLKIAEKYIKNVETL